MSKNRAVGAFTFITLDERSRVPLYRQLYETLREAVLTSRLPPGSAVPSSRELATDLGVSRNTALNALNQLVAEGYLVTKRAVGLFVPDTLPEECLAARAAPSRPPSSAPRATLSRRGEALARMGGQVSFGGPTGKAFRAGTPALDEFPADVWARLAARRRYLPPKELLGYGDGAGYLPLREALADYLRTARGVACEARQVHIFGGAQAAIAFAARLLVDPGDVGLVEDPGYVSARSALVGAGARVVPIRVDAEGVTMDDVASRGRDARLIYVTPSHQFPLGVTMSLSRRLELLDWAERTNCWIVEDDYDSEFRYRERPLAALHAIDRGDRVLYVGSLTKVLFPALRLSYLVVPPQVADTLASARLVDVPATFEQIVLADFIAEGHFTRHLRRLRALCATRQKVLLAEAARVAPDLIRLEPSDAGIFLLGRLPEGVDDVAVARAAAALGVDTQPLSALYQTEPVEHGLLLGYAYPNEREIREGLKRLAAAIRSTMAS